MIVVAINGFSNGSGIIGLKLNEPCERNVALYIMEEISFSTQHGQVSPCQAFRKGCACKYFELDKKCGDSACE